MDAQIAKELDAKCNFEAKRELEEYQTEGGFKPQTEVFSVEAANELFKLLCAQCKTKNYEFNTSENKYKVWLY